MKEQDEVIPKIGSIIFDFDDLDSVCVMWIPYQIYRDKEESNLFRANDIKYVFFGDFEKVKIYSGEESPHKIFEDSNQEVIS